jgi:hypothetical protein
MLLRVKQLKIGTYGISAFIIIALATLLRILLIAQGWPHTNGDEDTMGLMAIHVAYNGEHPTFFYGQFYMGSLEAFLGAAFFHLFGVSVFTLRLGTVLLFALFLASTYLLTSLLYTKKLALITVVLLSLGSTIMLDTELIALGGYPELLVFGTLSLLLASWLALSYDRYASRRIRLWRLIAYSCWGLVVGLGFWSDFLMLPFILVSGLLLALFCWRELLKGAVLPLALGVVIGAFPLIYYNLHAAPKTDTLTVMSLLHNAGHIELAQITAHTHLPLAPELRGTMLISLPAATGGTPFCYDSSLMLTGYLSTQKLQCSIAHGDWRLMTMALAWSLGYILLWTVAVFLTLRSLWRYRIRTSGKSWSAAERQAVVRYFARLMLLFSAGFILLLFIMSPVSAVFPGNSRYLIGLLVSIPALIAPLWGLSDDELVVPAGVSTQNNYHHTSGWFPITLNPETIKVALRRGLLLIIGIVLLVGTISAFLEIPTVQSYRQQDALMHDLLRINATHIYTDYWTCDSIAFLSKEQIICGVLDDHLQPSHNRYSPYYYIVKADRLTSYVFPVGSVQVATLDKQATFSNGGYRRFVFDGFVIYQPVSSVK